MRSVGELILYRNFAEKPVFADLADLVRRFSEGAVREENEEKRLLAQCIKELVETAERCGFGGNLWQGFLTLFLAENENAYSLACELRGDAKASVTALAKHDFAILLEYFQFDLERLLTFFDVDCKEAVLAYEAGNGHVFGGEVKEGLAALYRSLARAADAEEFCAEVTRFYQRFGVGALGLHRAFGIEDCGEDVRILPLGLTGGEQLCDVIGYESAKKKLVENTESFLNGRRANNCLLYGAAGTGKSTSVKALANHYYGRGLRIIEVYKHQLGSLRGLIARLRNRNYKFILYMDDLSFEEFEVEYKYLKALIEGGLEKKPDNLLIYATSNRRHLIRENFSDKRERGEDMHAGDTVQEKLSLSARFGVTIYYGEPDKKEFEEIVRALAQKHQLTMNEETLLSEANRWELSHGGRSGRAAQQLIDHLLGRL